MAACTAGTAAPATPAGDAPSAPSAATATVQPAATIDTLAARTEAELSVQGGPDLPVEGFGSLWLLTPDSDDPGITRLDPETNAIVATIPVGTRLCQAIGVTHDAIWACGKDGAVRVDPATNEIAATVEFEDAQTFGYLPFGGDSLWALGGQVTLTDKLVRLDPIANELVDTYDLGFDASWITFGADAVWISDTNGGILWRFDPETEELTEHASGLVEPGPSAFGAGSIWLAVHADEGSRPSPTDTTLVRIDPATGDVQAEIATGGTIFLGLIYAADDVIWVRAVEPFLTRIDPATNEITETLPANKAGGSVGVAFGSVWATSYDFNRVWRLQP